MDAFTKEFLSKELADQEKVVARELRSLRSALDSYEKDPVRFGHLAGTGGGSMVDRAQNVALAVASRDRLASILGTLTQAQAYEDQRRADAAVTDRLRQR